MASKLRNTTIILSFFAALGAAAPQRGQWGGGPPPWQQGQQSSSSSQQAVVTQTDQVQESFSTAVVLAGGSSVGGAFSSSSAFGNSATGTATGSVPTNTGTSGGGGGGDGGATGSMTPKSKKAGIAGINGVSLLGNHISWYYDWSPKPQGSGPGVPVSMLWGDGHVDATDAQRHSEFVSMTTQPDWLLGFNEPDCAPGVSANLQPGDAAKTWNSDFKPKIGPNTKVGSPAPCIQQGDWLDKFKKADSTIDWDFTAVHIYQDDVSKVGPVLDHFAKYGKPLWITEWACVATDTGGFDGCTDKTQIQDFITGMVDLLEKDKRVAAYSAITEGSELPPDAWNFVSTDGSSLTETGQVYLSAISKYG